MKDTIATLKLIPIDSIINKNIFEENDANIIDILRLIDVYTFVTKPKNGNIPMFMMHDIENNANPYLKTSFMPYILAVFIMTIEAMPITPDAICVDM